MDYNELCKEIKEALEPLNYIFSMFSVASVLLKDRLDGVNWAGFYIVRGDTLLLSAYSGKPACEEIKFGKGVCGKCAETKQIQRVANVHEFKGHIACDSDSNSEIVLPVFMNREFYAVLDIDSTEFSRFTEKDQKGLEAIVSIIEEEIEIALNY